MSVAAAADVDRAEVQLTLLDPATNQPWPLVSAGGAPPLTLTTLKIAR